MRHVWLAVLLATGCATAGTGGDGEEDAAVGTRTADEAALAEAVLPLVNTERANAALPPLEWHPGAADVAWLHSADMVARDYFGHASPEGDTAGERCDKVGIPWMSVGENLGKGDTTAPDVVKGWMGSPVHRENILKSGWTHMGVGVVEPEDGEPIWTQVFLTL